MLKDVSPWVDVLTWSLNASAITGSMSLWGIKLDWIDV
jgi:hypothetical protein